MKSLILLPISAILGTSKAFSITTYGTNIQYPSSSNNVVRRPAANNDNNDGDDLVRRWMQETKDQIGSQDSIRRRQLLFSLFAASGGTMIQPGKAAAAVSSPSEAQRSSQVEIQTPPLDDRDYETFTLPNGLRVLLCSDPSSNEAAAAMDVHVGACSDPDQVPGLAHFNEHMLFLGTKEFPKEASFEAFLAANGGSSNAFTDSEDTVYYFSMEAEAENRLSEALCRFGSFFSSPLFTQSATGRELNAIDSENAKNLQSDIFRIFQIQKSRANPKHPFSKFFTGNKRTLLEDTKYQKIDLRQQLISFYNKYYSANQMTLAIVAPQSLESLKAMVTKTFSAIPNRRAAKPEAAWNGIIAPFSKDSVIPSYGHIVEVVPVQDLRQLALAFPIIYQSNQDRQDSLLSKQADYVSHLLGHEGPGSLLSYLKKQQWANSLGSSTEAELSDFETFSVTIELTTQGLANIDRVAESVFSYIQMLKEERIPDYVFEEVLQLTELEWRFLTKGSPGNYVQSLVSSMQKYPPELYVAGPRRLALVETREKLISSSNPRSRFSNQEQFALTRSLTMGLIEKITVDNVMVTVLSKTFAPLADQKEKWYGTQYRVRPIFPETMTQWRYPVSAKDLGIAFPKPNVFIPSESGLRVIAPPPLANKLEKRSFESRMQPISPPKVIRDDGEEGRWTVFYKLDDRFGQPKAFVIFELLTKEVFSNPTRAALAQLYQSSATDRLEEYAYDARLAGLTFDVQVLPRGVRLTFGGYNDKLQEFASYVSIKLAKDIMSSLPQNGVEFDRYKDNLMRGLSAFDVKQPFAHGSYYAYLTLQPRKFQYTNAELRDAVRKTTLPDLVTYVKTLWSSGKGEALVQGNLKEREALILVDTIDKALNFKTIKKEQLPPRIKPLPLPSRSANASVTRLRIAEPNTSNENSAVHVLLQSLGRTEKDHVLIEILAAIVNEPFYGDLRTKQQLGYIVGSGIRALEESRTIAFVVQSSVAPVEKLSAEIQKFLDNFERNTLETLNAGDFAVYVKGLIDQKTEPDKQLANEVTRNWGEISTGRLQFDRVQREAAALLDCQKSDLIQFWRTIYGDGRRMLITEIVPSSGPASSTEPVSSGGYAEGIVDQTTDGLLLGIDDIAKFRFDREQESN